MWIGDRLGFDPRRPRVAVLGDQAECVATQRNDALGLDQLDARRVSSGCMVKLSPMDGTARSMAFSPIRLSVAKPPGVTGEVDLVIVLGRQQESTRLPP